MSFGMTFSELDRLIIMIQEHLFNQKESQSIGYSLEINFLNCLLIRNIGYFLLSVIAISKGQRQGKKSQLVYDRLLMPI